MRPRNRTQPIRNKLTQQQLQEMLHGKMKIAARELPKVEKVEQVPKSVAALKLEENHIKKEEKEEPKKMSLEQLSIDDLCKKLHAAREVLEKKIVKLDTAREELEESTSGVNLLAREIMKVEKETREELADKVLPPEEDQKEAPAPAVKREELKKRQIEDEIEQLSSDDEGEEDSEEEEDCESKTLRIRQGPRTQQGRRNLGWLLFWLSVALSAPLWYFLTIQDISGLDTTMPSWNYRLGKFETSQERFESRIPGHLADRMRCQEVELVEVDSVSGNYTFRVVAALMPEEPVREGTFNFTFTTSSGSRKTLASSPLKFRYPDTTMTVITDLLLSSSISADPLELMDYEIRGSNGQQSSGQIVCSDIAVRNRAVEQIAKLRLQPRNMFRVMWQSHHFLRTIPNFVEYILSL